MSFSDLAVDEASSVRDSEHVCDKAYDIQMEVN